MTMPMTPERPSSLSFYILLASVRGSNKAAITSTIKKGLV